MLSIILWFACPLVKRSAEFLPVEVVENEHSCKNDAGGEFPAGDVLSPRLEHQVHGDEQRRQLHDQPAQLCWDEARPLVYAVDEFQVQDAKDEEHSQS